MNKKGGAQKTILYIFYILIALVILSIFYSRLSNYFNGAEMDKEFISRDLGLMIDTASFSPMSIIINYNFPKESIIENKDSVLKVKLKLLESPREYLFLSEVEDFSIKPNKTKIEKNGEIRIS